MDKQIFNGKEKDEKKYIVGIGASAGGLEALQKLLTKLPADTGFPFIIVQHLSPDYKSLLGEILSKYTKMPVISVEDGMEVEPNKVYVIQPGKNMRISNNKLLLSSQKGHELNLPIDMFFRSLAEDAMNKAIAIILSGTGSDGSNGIKSIKENDGMIIVQAPESAKFDGMPKSAIRTGLVDAQITPEEMALELQHISSTVYGSKSEYKTEKEIDEELMKKIYFILKKVSNINFTHYKQTTILRRIERRMMLTHMERLVDYVDLLYTSPDEVMILSKEVLIGVTNFFRDPEFFQKLKDKAIQNILIHSKKDEDIRVWVAGCSTGEEAYSIAILFTEVMESLKIKKTVKIFATDLDVEAVTTAGKGIYNENIIDSVSPSRLSRYFIRHGNTYEINRDIRKMIVFSPHNVFQDPPFGRLDLISCRNMLIYFQPVLQNDLFAIFHSAIRDGGYLFLGKSEAIGAYTEAFPVIDVAAKIFTHRSNVKIPGAKIVPFIQAFNYDDDYYGFDSNDTKHRFIPDKAAKQNEASIDISLLERFMPACLIINDKNELVHTFGENSNYIHFSLGKVSNGLYDVITEALKVPVSTLLKEARNKEKLVQWKDICFVGEREEAVINLTAMPMNNVNVSKEDELYALIFSDNKGRGEVLDAAPYEIDQVASQRITDLEQDLNIIQDKLNRSVTEQECVNEELQAANEELLTANEELQSSNEELQSVNEELYTVNTEYQLKLSELADLNDDIANFLSSTLIGIIFVDNKLNIRRYTDYVASEFSVMDHDIGRSLRFISYHFPTVDITELCDNVLKTLVPDEREVTTSKNKIFFMRIAPYRTIENKILGCVITLVDVTTQKQGLVQLKDTEQKLTIVQQASEAKSDFISKVAHEIKTPMSALSSLTEIAMEKIENGKDLKETLNQIKDTSKYMNSIVEDILEMSQVEHIDGIVNESFILFDALDGVVKIISSKASEKNQELNLDFSKAVYKKYYGSKSRVQQILINFLSNAVKYTDNGGKIYFRAYEEATVGNRVGMAFEIEDTGIGIGKDFLPQLFTPFAKENRGNSSQKFSMGLGLSIAYKLIKSMDGDVEVESEIDKGSKFTIHIILENQEVTPSKSKDKSKRDLTSLEGLHVLIADDNAMNRQILISLLAPKNITCEEACDGSEAVKMFMGNQPHTFDCVLMDIRMPKMDGIDATAAIRTSGKSDAKTIPIIGISANGFQEDVDKAMKAGIDSYSIKPIDTQKLFKTIRSLLERNKDN